MSDSKGCPESSKLVPDSADDVQQASSSLSSNPQSSDSIVEYPKDPDAVSSRSCEVEQFKLDQPSSSSEPGSVQDMEVDEIRAGLDSSHGPGISDDKKASESEVSQASVTSENVQSRTHFEKPPILTNIVPSGGSTHRKISQSSSQSVREIAKNLDSCPHLLECLSPKKKPRVISHDTVSQFRECMDGGVSNEMYNELLRESNLNDTEHMDELFAETFKAESSKEKEYLKGLFNKTIETFKAFTRAKVFLKSKFPTDLTSIEIGDVEPFCSDFDVLNADSGENLDIEFELSKVISEPYPSLVQNWWCKYSIMVDYLVKTSDKIVRMFISADNDKRTKCDSYARLCASFISFLHRSKNKLVIMQKSMIDFFELFDEVNESLRTIINNLQDYSNKLYAYLVGIRIEKITLKE